MNLPASNQLTEHHNLNEPIYSHCDSIAPLRPHLEAWTNELIQSRRLFQLVDKFDSPLNLHFLPQFEANTGSFKRMLESIPLQSNIFFARKANKCLAYVTAARQLGLGIDVASEEELDECCSSGFGGNELICTANVKPLRLLRRCLQTRVPIVIDSVDEFLALLHVVTDRLASASIYCGMKHKVLLRIKPDYADVAGGIHPPMKETSVPRQTTSKFGLTKPDLLWILKTISQHQSQFSVIGTHFHLESSDIGEHAKLICEALKTNELLQHAGFAATTIDCGGGIPVQIYQEPTAFHPFLHTYKQAQAGCGDSVTYQNRAYIELSAAPNTKSLLNVYPNAITDICGVVWLQQLLETKLDQMTIAAHLAKHQMILNFELGRSLLNNSGVTVARVNFREPLDQLCWAIGLEMNPTQWRTTHDDMLLDPLLIPNHHLRSKQRLSKYPYSQVQRGVLVGACCAEDNLISPRLLSFPPGVAVGDLILFPNTSPYRMHFHESRLHRQRLARNLIFTDISDWSYSVDAGEESSD